MKNQQLGILLLLATTLSSIPVALSVPATKGSITRHFDIYQNNSTGGKGCSSQLNCFNSTSPGNPITVNQGDTVEFTVRNNDSIAHTFTLISSPYTVDVHTSGYHQNSSSTPFVANTAGTFKYECTIHPNDMFGNFVVTPVSPTIIPTSLLALLGTTSVAVFIMMRKRR